MIEAEKYNEQFFEEMEAGSFNSAKKVLPLVNGFIHPRKVIDVGCGTGVWLSVWDQILGVKDYLGIEGPYVKKEMFKVPSNKIILKDLKHSLEINEEFDLAMSLEVAEHLPKESAEKFIKELTLLSDVILFSAAIPGQGGTHHINEQYPEYWAEIFKQQKYIPVDCIRPNIWTENGVEFWYKQNLLLFIKEESLARYPSLAKYAEATYPHYLSRIHPVFFDLINEHMRRTKNFVGFLNWKWYVFKKKYLNK